MKNQHTFTNRGRTWSCQYDPISDHWTAVSSNPDIRICASSWKGLREELKVVDTTIPRQDGVAVCDLLSPLGVVQGL